MEPQKGDERNQEQMNEEVPFLSPQPSHTSSGQQDIGEKSAQARIPAKRASYASRACLECQKRKTKCFGSPPGPCQTCRTNSWDCVYNTRPRKKRAVHKDNPEKQHEKSSFQTERKAERRESNAHQELLLRLARLEDEWEAEKNRRSSNATAPDKPLSLQQTSSNLTPDGDEIAVASPEQYEQSLNEGLELDSAPQNPLIRVSVRRPSSAKAPVHAPTAPLRCSFADRENVPACCQHDLRLWTDSNATVERQNVRRALHRFFDFLNPHYPCLNQAQVFAQLDHYVPTSPTAQPSVATAQFVALVHLVMALVSILEDTCTREDQAPGWLRYQQASHLLQHTAWISTGNLLTVQCMIIKATYLLYSEKFNASYETAGQAVRVCYLLGLHNQSPDEQEITPFESHLRQRVFWSLYCLERNISQVCGVPYSIRDSDINVPLPAALDDSTLGDSEQLPGESPTKSCIPYLWSTVKWARLSSEIWDCLFCAKAARPAEEEFIVSMDARILFLRESLPPQLRWQKPGLEATTNLESPPYIQRQAMILHLRINHLRLQLRREEVLRPEFRSRDLKECLAIARDTVNVVRDFYFSPAAEPLQRYSCVAYLTGAVIAIASILLGPRPMAESFDTALQTLTQALRVLRHIAPGLSMARHTLKKLGNVIATCEKLEAPWLALGPPISSDVQVPSLGGVPLDTSGQKSPEVSLEMMQSSNFDFGPVDDGFVRMAYTPAFDTHYWDQQLVDL